jgi:SAM-dependent methyltransferase
MSGIDFKCPACGSLLTAAIPWPIRKCNACGEALLSPDEIPLLVKNTEEVKSVIAAARELGRQEWYESPQSSQWSGPYRHHFMRRVQYIRKEIAEFKRGSSDKALVGLDLGCGDGGNLPWLMEYVSCLYASDYNMVRLLRASKISKQVRIFWADITDYPAADDSFDLIFFNHVLEHIPDDAKALAEVRRILKPDGLLILGVPNEGALFWRLAYQLQPKTLASSDHVHFYTAEDISDKCRQAGFNVKEVHPIGWGVPHWGIDERLRGWKWVDDLFERIGRAVIPSQATSLYLLLSK